MKCLICHGEDIQVKSVYEEITRGNDVVRFPFKVPVCANCGKSAKCWFARNEPHYSICNGARHFDFARAACDNSCGAGSRDWRERVE